MKHVEIFRQEGRFGGWPANYGMYSFDDEIVVVYTVGTYGSSAGFHAVDPTKPFETRQSRSLDGGVTWQPSIVMPAITPGGRGISADEHLRPGLGLKAGEALEDGSAELLACPGDVPFHHPELALMVGRTGLAAGCVSFFYWSTDRCKSWAGPFSLPLLGTAGMAGRTDCIPLGPRTALLLVTVNKRNGKEGRVCALRTEDGGASWTLASYLGTEPTGYQIMPASVRLSSGSILSATRTSGPAEIKIGEKTFDTGYWIDLWRSDDEGLSFSKVSTPVEVSRSGNPATLTLLPDGRLVMVVGWRLPPYGVRAKVSSDEGMNWSDWIVLRDDAGTGDIGYPRTVLSADGTLVTAYYFADAPDSERYIGATVWKVPVAGPAKC